MVVLGQRAATCDDDSQWDSNSANFDLAVLTKSVAVASQGERKNTCLHHADSAQSTVTQQNDAARRHVQLSS